MKRPTRMPTPREKKLPALRRTYVRSVWVAPVGDSTKRAIELRWRRWRWRRRLPLGALYGLV